MTHEQRLHHALRNGGREQILAAYDDVMADEMPKRGGFANQAVTVEQAAPLAEDKMNAFHAYEQGLSAEDVTKMNEMRTPAPGLYDESAALLAQHNADVDARKAQGDKRHNGRTFVSILESIK